jgi:threonyl-tRNA synthetase
MGLFLINIRRNMESSIETIRHSLSHVLASAVLEVFPDAKLAIGPSIENGFYYDFDLPRTLIPEDLPIIEEKMKKLISQDLSFERTEVEIEEALKIVKDSNQDYKKELIEDLGEEGKKEVSFYKTGEFIDLCQGPHITSTKELQGVAFKLDKIAGAYWKGNEKNKMLQRIYALSLIHI